MSGVGGESCIETLTQNPYSPLYCPKWRLQSSRSEVGTLVVLLLEGSECGDRLCLQAQGWKRLLSCLSLSSKIKRITPKLTKVIAETCLRLSQIVSQKQTIGKATVSALTRYISDRDYNGRSDGWMLLLRFGLGPWMLLFSAPSMTMTRVLSDVPFEEWTGWLIRG